MKKKKGAFELSMSTIVVVVLALILLGMGVFLIRSIMCGSITMVNDINEGLADSIDDIFQTSAEEVVCYGGGDEEIGLEEGKINNLKCRINTPETREYRIKIEKIYAPGDEISESTLNDWLLVDEWESEVGAGSETVHKIAKIDIPDGVDLVQITIEIYAEKKVGNEWKKADGSTIIDYKIEKGGALRAAFC
ncbi:MAG: hypothetical protein U9Q06_04710 [Nanoarchaeota archaeon]|nr:hypothetical protein [Nanoarchaeota archaeon]